MPYTHDQIIEMLKTISQAKWVAFDHEVQEFPELDPEDLTEGGAWWIHGPAFVDYGDYSCFTKADARFIAAAPQIVKQLLDEVDHLRSQLDSVQSVQTSKTSQGVSYEDIKQQISQHEWDEETLGRFDPNEDD